MNWSLLLNSLSVSAAATLLAVALGSMTAFWLNGVGNRFQPAVFALAAVTLTLPPFLVTNSWLHLLGETGVWRSWLPFNILTRTGALWILTLMLWPIPMFAAIGALRRLEAPQLECDPAVTGWMLIRFILFPLTRSAILQAAVLTFVLALNNFAVPSILQVKVLPAELWVKFNTTFDTLGAARQSWPLVLLPLVALLWLSRREIAWPSVAGTLPPKLFRQQLGPAWFWCGAVLFTALSLFSVGIPVLELLLTKRTWLELPGALAAGQLALWNSILYASLAALVCFGLSILTWRLPLGIMLWLPFLAPGILVGIGLIYVFNRPWLSAFYQSAGIVVLAYTIRYLAFSWNGLAYAMRLTDPALTDSARLDGASRLQMLRYVYWPQIATQVCACTYLVFLLCLWDVESMILVVPPGGETLALRIFNLLHYGHNSQVDALCLLLLAVALAPLAAWGFARSFATAWERRNLHANGRYLPSALCGIVAPAVLCTFLLTGCSPTSSGDRDLHASRLFRTVQIIGSRGVGVGQLNKPRSVAVDASDNLYVVDMTGRVQKFSPAGAFLLSWQMPQTDLGKPKGMCRDRAGNIVVVEPHYQRVNHFSTNGQLVAQWGRRGTNTGQFMMPRAVAVNSRGEIVVSEYMDFERVQRFSPGGSNLLNSIGRMGSGPGEFNRPEGLCVDAQDRIYVADACNHRIQVFSSDGTFLRAYGKPGSGLGELSYPYDICVDPAGFQYVCEFGNSRIQIFDAKDQPVEIIGRPGGDPGQFSNPWGVALDSAGNLYVADSQNHRVQKLIRRVPLLETKTRP